MLQSGWDALLSQLKNRMLLQKKFQIPAKTQSNFIYFFFSKHSLEEEKDKILTGLNTGYSLPSAT